MTDWTLDPHVTLVFGAQKSGKTTFALRYLLNVCATRFIFDDRGQAARRLQLPHCSTLAECNAALQSCWVCFNPWRMFQPTKIRDAFRWFCWWALEVSKGGNGKKVLFCDEAWQHVDARSAPEELENIARTGRGENLELLLATHRPSEYPRSVRALVTEWVCFNTVDRLDLDAVSPYFTGVDACADLKRGEFLSYDRATGEELAGRLF